MKKPSLAAAMETLDTRGESRGTLPAIATPEPSKPAAAGNPGRAGKEQVLGWFSHECKKQLKFMGADQDKSQQELLAEALNDLFRKYGKPTIA